MRGRVSKALILLTSGTNAAAIANINPNEIEKIHRSANSDINRRGS